MKTRTMILCALFAALTAVGAFFKIPFALAAISLQFLFTAMAGVLLGAGYGALSQAVYVLIGLVGVPIYALGGGFSYIFQPFALKRIFMKISCSGVSAAGDFSVFCFSAQC